MSKPYLILTPVPTPPGASEKQGKFQCLSYSWKLPRVQRLRIEPGTVGESSLGAERDHTSKARLTLRRRVLN